MIKKILMEKVLMSKFLEIFRLRKVLIKKILVKKILVKKILMKKIIIFFYIYKYYQNLLDYRRNYRLTHKKELSDVFKAARGSSLFSRIRKFFFMGLKFFSFSKNFELYA